MQVNYPSDLQRLLQQTGIIHPVFGDLLRPQAVCMDRKMLEKGYIEKSPYFVHLTVTGRCNARCRGCINNGISFQDEKLKEFLSPEYDLQPERDSKGILSLLEQEGAREAWICFYGGEPLILPDKMDTFIHLLESGDHSYRFCYMLYTNGQLLDRAVEKHSELLKKFDLFSVSIDGQHQQHNQIRHGTDLEKIHRNLRRLREVRNGPVLMWSTLREEQSLEDCFEEFLYLHEQGLADHFFWHWVETQYPFQDFSAYLRRYEQDLEVILDHYIIELKRGRVLSILHLNELILFLLTGKQRGTTGCGVEVQRNLDLTGGKILACSDLGPEWEIGYIEPSGQPHLIRRNYEKLIEYKQPLGCSQCGVHGYCGGRCPVEALHCEPKRLVEYCQLMRLHVGLVQGKIPQIQRWIRDRGISLQEIYDRSVFYVQFTDVTP
jgi:radical SAM protein with 4Fe4S-binding SPASM domain